MTPLTRITIDPDVMGGEPCIRGMRITLGMIIGLVAGGAEAFLKSLPRTRTSKRDVRQSLSYIGLDRRFDEIKSGMGL